MTFSRILPLALLFFTGCAGNNLGRPRIPVTLTAPSILALYTVSDFQKDFVIYHVAVSVCSRATAEQNCTARQLRNAIINRIRTDIELCFREYENQLFLGRASQNTALDAMELGMSTAATLAGAAGTKTIISAILTGMMGIRLSYDRNFYAEKSIPIILSKMEILRDTVSMEIEGKMALDVNDYPLEAAWVDLVELFYSGTLMGGVQALMSDAGLATQQMRLQRNQRLQERLSTVPIPKP